MLLSACKETETAYSEKGIYIRITNGSSTTYDQLAFYGVAKDESFGEIMPGETSRYRLSPAPFLPSLVLRVGTDTIQSECVLMDKMPPPRLLPGFYTYNIELVDLGGTVFYGIR